MNGLQRALRSMIRKPVKSILLLLVIFIISLFLLSGMTSKSANVETQDKTRQAIGAGLRLEKNEVNRGKRLEEISLRIDGEGTLEGVHQEKMESNSGTQWVVWTDNFFETLLIEDIEKIASVPHIENYNITTVPTPVNPINFKRIEDSDVDQNYDFQGVCLIGNRDMTMDSNVLTGNVTLKEGRMVTEEDLDVCVISEELAEHSNLRLGDKLQFNDYHDRENSKRYKAIVIGIYQTDERMTPFMSGDTFRSENIIFTDLGFPEKAEGNEDDPLYKYAYFKVEDVNQYETVKDLVKRVDIDWERYDLIDNNGNLDTMSSNFNDLASISEILIWIVVFASFIILFLIFLFWMKNRAKEIGILLSLGTSKIGILGQFVLEALLIGVVAVSLSFIVAPGVSNATAEYLALQQAEQASVKKDLDIGKIATDYVEPDLEVIGVNIEITPKMIGLDIVAIAILISVSICIAGITIIRRNPKDILSDMN